MCLEVRTKQNKIQFSVLPQFLSPQLRQLLCNVLIQPHFDYVCSVWYPNLNKKFKTKLQTLQNNCVHFVKDSVSC